MQQQHHQQQQHMQMQMQQQQQQLQMQQQQHVQVQVPYVKPMSQYMLKKQQRAKEAAAAAAALQPPGAAPKPLQSGLNPIQTVPSVNEKAIPTPNVPAPSALKYRPPTITQHQPTVARPQPSQQQHVAVAVPIQHVPYIPPIPVGPVFVRENLPESAWPKKIMDATKELNSNDPTVVIKGLNSLLMKSFESDIGITLQIENYPDLTSALGSLLDALNPIANVLFSDKNARKITDKMRESDMTGIKRKLDGVHATGHNTDDRWNKSLPSEGNQLFKVPQ